MHKTLVGHAKEVRDRWRRGERVERAVANDAAAVLAGFHVDRRSLADLLTQQIDKRTAPTSVTAPTPITSYVYAEALVRLGGSEATQALIESLRAELSHTQIQVRAYIASQLDETNVTHLRLNQAFQASQDGPHPADPREVRFRENIHRLQANIDLDSFKDYRRWPSNLDQPRPVDDLAPTPPGPPADAEPPTAKTFRVDNMAHRIYLSRLAEAARYEATIVLWRREQRQPVADDLACVAAELLAEVPHTDKRAPLRLLVANVALRRADIGEPKGPLSGYPAAQSISTIGGRHLAEMIFDSLNRETVSARELLLMAFVLHHNDSPPVNLERTRLIDKHDPRHHISLRLTQLKTWLQAPEFFDDPSNWPSRMKE